MKAHNKNCPMCGTNLSSEHVVGDMLICRCGWSKSSNKKYTINIKQGVMPIAFVGIFLLLGFLQVVNWNNHSLRIIPLKLSQWTGTANFEQLKKIASICSERKKVSCQELALKQAYKKDIAQIETLAEISFLQMAQNKEKDAYKTLYNYFTHGGNNLKAHHIYAKLLGKVGKVRKSQKHFRYVLNAKPKEFQISVARDYVRMLIANQHLSKARTLIYHYRRMSVNASYFLHKELKQIETELLSRASKVSSL